MNQYVKCFNDIILKCKSGTQEDYREAADTFSELIKKISKEELPKTHFSEVDNAIVFTDCASYNGFVFTTQCLDFPDKDMSYLKFMYVMYSVLSDLGAGNTVKLTYEEVIRFLDKLKYEYVAFNRADA